MKKILLWILAAVVVGFVTVLLWPGNYYVHRALFNLYPKIDQYPIFSNRVVKAGDPMPMDYAPGVEQTHVDERFLPDFEKYGTVAFLVMQHGQIVSEEYWEDYGPQSHSNSFSMAKSIVSLLVGCAITDGYIDSVGQPVSDFLPEWGSFNGKPLTIRDLLTMSAGVKWDESSTSLFSTTTEAYYGKDLWSLAQREILIEEPGVYFNYQSGVTQILAFVLKKATGRNIADYASEKIWTPIQAEEDALWSLDHENGMEKAYCCFNSNARDFARLGQLVLQNGFWYRKLSPEQALANDTMADAVVVAEGLEGFPSEEFDEEDEIRAWQEDRTELMSQREKIAVVDSAYMAQATSPATYLKTILNDGTEAPCTMYGYQFWRLRHDNLDVVYFRGILGQYIFVIPALDAVIVRLGHERSDEYNVEQDYPVDIDTWLDAGIEILERRQ